MIATVSYHDCAQTYIAFRRAHGSWIGERALLAKDPVYRPDRRVGEVVHGVEPAGFLYRETFGGNAQWVDKVWNDASKSYVAKGDIQ